MVSVGKRILSGLLGAGLLWGLAVPLAPAVGAAEADGLLPEEAIEQVIPPFDPDSMEWDFDGNLQPAADPLPPGVPADALPMALQADALTPQGGEAPASLPPELVPTADGGYRLDLGNVQQGIAAGTFGANSVEAGAVVDLSGVTLPIPAEGAAALHIENGGNLTLKGLTIAYGAAPVAGGTEEEEVENIPRPEDAPPAESAAPESGAPAESSEAPLPASEPEPETPAASSQPADASSSEAPDAPDAPAASGSTSESESTSASAPESGDTADASESTLPGGEDSSVAPAAGSALLEVGAVGRAGMLAATAFGDIIAPAVGGNAGDDALLSRPTTGATALAVEGCTSLQLQDVRIIGAAGTGIQVGAGCARVALDGVFIETTGESALAFGSGVQEASVQNSLLQSRGSAITSRGGGLLVQSSLLQAPEGIILQGAHTDAVIRQNTFDGLAGAALAGKGSQNTLFASNAVLGGSAVQLENATNAVILGNALEGAPGGVTLRGGKNLTIADNDLATPLHLVNVDTAIVNGNTVNGAEAMDSAIVLQEGSTKNVYGNNLNAVETTAVGAKASLLPKPSPNLFVDMPRKTTITNAAGEKVDVVEYITETLETSNEVIIPPGAYSVPRLNLSKVKDASILAYGVLFEFPSFLEKTVTFSACENVALKGLYIDYENIGHTQGTVVSIKGNTAVWKADPGYMADLTDRRYFDSGTLIGAIYKKGAETPYRDIHYHGNASKNGNGTMTLKGGTSSPKVGDKIVLRAKFCQVTVMSSSSKMLYEDVTVLGGSGFGYTELTGEGGNRLNRAAITPGPAPKLPGGGRGPARMVSTCDGSHSTQMREGWHVSNCFFEKMTDDGANICGEYVKATSYSKGSRTLAFDNSTGRNFGLTFRPGDRLMAFTLDGRLLADCIVKEASVHNGNRVTIKLPAGAKMKFIKNKTLVENASANGGGFIYENNLFQKNRSRGITVKAPTGTVRNNTLRKNGQSGVLVKPEMIDGWGECGFARKISITGNLIDSTGYISGTDTELFAPINISTDVIAYKNREFQSQKGVTVQKNEIRNRYVSPAIHVLNAQDIKILNNKFGPRAAAVNNQAKKKRDTAVPVKVEGATNVIVQGNKYPKGIKAKVAVDKETCTKVRGKDIK